MSSLTWLGCQTLKRIFGKHKHKKSSVVCDAQCREEPGPESAIYLHLNDKEHYFNDNDISMFEWRTLPIYNAAHATLPRRSTTTSTFPPGGSPSIVDL